MHTPVLTAEERHHIDSASWFSKLSQPLRDAILSRAIVRRLADGALLSSRGEPADWWCGVAKGAVRVSSVSLSGKQITLTYVEPGVWFGDMALFDGLPRTHDSNAHGETTLLIVRKADFKELLSQHVEPLYARELLSDRKGGVGYQVTDLWNVSTGVRNDLRKDRSPIVPLTQQAGERTDVVTTFAMPGTDPAGSMQFSSAWTTYYLSSPASVRSSRIRRPTTSGS